MENMRFKVGDKVRIKSLDWYNENKDSKHGYVDCGNGIGFYKHMTEYCGKVMTISQIWNHSYEMEDHVSNWNDEMIEGLVEEENESELIPYFEEGTNKILYYKNKNTFECYFPMRTPEYICPEGYIFKDENGNVINAMKIVLEKKKNEYPKTYEECCAELNYLPFTDEVVGYKWDLIQTFQQLLICRDAYWKIAGEEMGLGKPWKPNWQNDEQFKYVIICRRNCVIKDTFTAKDVILAFPTEEMRDAFYENFKSEIEECKELL